MIYCDCGFHMRLCLCHPVLHSCSKLVTSFVAFCSRSLQLHPCIDSEFHALALAGKSCLLWAGYISRKGEARYGSHLLGVSREGLKRLTKFLDKEASEAALAGDSLSYLEGLDTWIWRGKSRTLGSMAFVHVWGESFAHQAQHSLSGRR